MLRSASQVLPMNMQEISSMETIQLYDSAPIPTGNQHGNKSTVIPSITSPIISSTTSPSTYSSPVIPTIATSTAMPTITPSIAIPTLSPPSPAFPQSPPLRRRTETVTDLSALQWNHLFCRLVTLI